MRDSDDAERRLEERLRRMVGVPPQIERQLGRTPETFNGLARPPAMGYPKVNMQQGGELVSTGS